MKNDIQAAKAVVFDFYKRLDSATPEVLGDVVEDHTTDNYLWRGYHPFHEQTSATQVAHLFWQPLRNSLKHLQRRQDIFMAGRNEMDDFSSIHLNPKAKIKTSWIYNISKKVNTRPSLYLKAGALHGCVLCHKDTPLIYVEDVGRHNAVDKIAGWMFLNKEEAKDKIFYTTGRLTSEMVIKTAQMGIPILISRSGFTESGVKLAKEAGLTLIGRAKGKRMIIANGIERVIFDTDTNSIKVDDAISAQRSLIN